MSTIAVVLQAPGEVQLRELPLDEAGPDDLIVDMEWSGISTGTERLLWSGRMPAFPGMGYPLVPGYEGVGRVRSADRGGAFEVGRRVFVPGARCFGPVRGLFGSSASRVVVPAARVVPIADALGQDGLLLALAATAWHALESRGDAPELIVGHGVLGRLLARLCLLRSARPPVVWESNPQRREGGAGYAVIDPREDTRRDYHAVCDVSGDPAILDRLIAHLAPGGEIVLAGFYAERLSFDFPAAFMREARIRIAAQWRPQDLAAVRHLAESGALSLSGLLTHSVQASDAPGAYQVAFEDPSCLKMSLDWRTQP